MTAGIYIHIPFCRQKCLYCDFVSGCGNDEEMEAYQKALTKEIESTRIDEMVDSVFFGGGTPTIYPLEYISHIMQVLDKKGVHFDECTMEANPGTVDLYRLREYRSLGINRLSIGLQSADDMELRTLGRIHNYEQFLEAYDSAVKAGFDNINIDLMSAIPGQTVQSYKDTLYKVVSLRPKHISAYSLIIEEETPFYEMYGESGKENRDVPKLPDEDTERQMYYVTKEILSEYGYGRYEISNYAMEGYECRHNLKYWNRSNYYGFGAAASSLTGNIRYTNVRNRQRYVNIMNSCDNKENCSNNPFGVREEILQLDEREKMEEFMFLGLRKMEGVSKERFRNLFLIDIMDIYRKQIEDFVNKGLLMWEGDYIRLTDKGIDVSNLVMAEFLFD